MLTITVSSFEDVELVRQSIHRDRDAYGKIVAKYQALIRALTYSACGDLQASEDLAQATFVTWRRLTGGSGDFLVGWPQKRQFVVSPMDASLEELVRDSKKPVRVLVQGRNFEIFGWPGRLPPLLCVFVIGAGVVLVVGRKAGAVQNVPATP